MKRPIAIFLFAIAILIWVIANNALAFENRECLECHGDPKLVQVLESGELRSIFVDPNFWEGDVHNKKGIKCVDCHPQASPRSHPRGGFVKADCARCHPEDCEAFQSTVHAQMAGLAEKALPQCYHCHTEHAVRTKEDPESTVHEGRIKETCRQCHPEILPGGLLNGMATFRIHGHRKEDASRSFAMKVCILCHQEDASHGRARIYHGMCNECHKPRIKGAILGATHLIPTLKEQPLTFVLKYLDGVAALCIIVAIAALLISRYRRKICSMLKRDHQV